MINVNNDHGGEQGLELGQMQLQQDYDAAREALDGWYRDSLHTLHDRMSWFNEARFGCFVHWGPYADLESVWAGRLFSGYAEHIMRMAQIPVETYKNLVVKRFNPFEFNAEEWMLQVKRTGMKYFIITAKHHDGFAMWHSDAYSPQPNYPSYDPAIPGYDMRMTRFNERDPILELRDAARRHGIRFGLYYSHAFDWEHPHAPGNDWDDFRAINGFTAGLNPGGDRRYGDSNWWLNNIYRDFMDNADYYLVNKSLPHIAELVRKYDPDIMWFDTPHKIPLYQNIRVTKYLRELKPDMVINGRLARWGNFQLGDYENSGDRAAYLFPLAHDYWETIPTTNESYGFSSIDDSHKPPSHFIRLLAAAASKGGNVLLNVGPMGSGRWDPRDISIFNAIGDWLEKNGESIYGTTRTNDIPIPNWGVITRKNNRLYLHVHQWPHDGVLWLGSLKASIQSAVILATGQAVSHSQEGNDIRFLVPLECPDADSTVIVLELEGNYTSYPHRLLDPHSTNVLQAFDAVLTGDFSRGDGKVGNNFLSRWRSNDMYISWNVSLREPKTFNLLLEYNSSGNAGTVSIEIGGMSHDLDFTSGDTSSAIGPVDLDAGNHHIRLKGKTLNNEYLRPRTLTFLPQ